MLSSYDISRIMDCKTAEMPHYAWPLVGLAGYELNPARLQAPLPLASSRVCRVCRVSRAHT